MKKSRLKGTFALIEKLRPMIHVDELDAYEEIHGMGNFDVMFKQKDDEKTMWGDSQMKWTDTTLRSLANNIYDYLVDNYEMWVRETPKKENDPPTISDENIRYAISLEADNLTEDDAPLDCRIVSGWLVMSAYYDATFDEKRKFFEEFGYTEPFKLGPSNDDVNYLIEQEIENLANNKIKTFQIISIRSKKIQCSHCVEQHAKGLELSERYDDLGLDARFEQVLELEKKWLQLKKEITKERFQEQYDKILKLKKELTKERSDRDDLLLELENIENRKEYRCNVCKTVFCDLNMRLKRVCIDCGQKIEFDIASKRTKAS